MLDTVRKFFHVTMSTDTNAKYDKELADKAAKEKAEKEKKEKKTTPTTP